MKKIILLLSIALMAWTVSFSQTTTLQVIHNSADPVLDSIDVYVDVPLLLDEKILSDFPFTGSFFSDLSAEINLFGGTLPVKVQITPAGQPDTVINEAVTLIAGKTYLAFAVGVVDTTKFAPNPDGKSIALKLDTIERAPIGADPGFAIATIFNGVTDAPALDISLLGLGNPALNLAYGTLQAADTPGFAVPPKPVDFIVTEHKSGKSIGTFACDFSSYGGQAIVMYFAGFLHPDSNQNGAPFGLFIADTSNHVVQVPEIASGVKTIGKSLSALNLYPSPATNILSYKYTLTASADISVSVFNNAGALIYSRRYGIQTPGRYSESLDVSNFAAGIYTVKIGDTKNTTTGTFVKK